jgi:hypothetical protein
MMTAPSGWNPDSGRARTAASHAATSRVHGVSIALQVNATSRGCCTRKQAVGDPVTGDAAATENDVATGGRHAKIATASVMVVVTIADTLLLPGRSEKGVDHNRRSDENDDKPRANGLRAR